MFVHKSDDHDDDHDDDDDSLLAAGKSLEKMVFRWRENKNNF